MKKYYLQLDIAKAVFCLFIVAIHAYLYPNILYPWLRIAVPMFFLISSFLFWDRVLKIEDNKERLIQLKRYALRNAFMYLFYFVIILPQTLVKIDASWFAGGFFPGLGKIFVYIFTLSGFQSFWFILSLIVVMPIVYFLSRKNNIAIIIIGVLLFLLSALFSAYKFIFPQEARDTISTLINFDSIDFAYTPVQAFIWIVLGKLLAQYKFNVKTWVLAVFSVISIGLFVMEYLLIKSVTGVYSYPVYLGLVPMCVSFMMLLLKINYDKEPPKFMTYLRKTTVVIYALHNAFIIMFIDVGVHNSLVLFFASIGLCIVASVVLQLLQKIKFLNWLKIAT